MNPIVQLRKVLAVKAEAAQIAQRDPYADLAEVVAVERARGTHFLRDGAHHVGPGPVSSASEEGLTPDGIGEGSK